MMMRIDDRQLGFEDLLLLLSCQPRIVGLAAVTEPAWLDGLRHRMLLFCRNCLDSRPVMSIVSLFVPTAKSPRRRWRLPFPCSFSSLARAHGHRQHSGSKTSRGILAQGRDCFDFHDFP